MILERSVEFDADIERQFEWYLTRPNLEPEEAVHLAGRFAVAVARTLDFLLENPEAGRRRFARAATVSPCRSWRVDMPFHRFLIFYRLEGDTLQVDRLLEGHTSQAAQS
jgi:plasmid stabilization system protein ParE